VPSAGERNQLLTERAIRNNIGLNEAGIDGYAKIDNPTYIQLFRNDFYLPLADQRRYSDALINKNDIGNYGFYWSSSPFSSEAHILYLDSSAVEADVAYRASGSSVRCFKNTIATSEEYPTHSTQSFTFTINQPSGETNFIVPTNGRRGDLSSGQPYSWEIFLDGEFEGIFVGTSTQESRV
jgi:hypothetical protein